MTAPENTPAIVIGAGIIGCAVARELASRGRPCIVIDDRPVAGGATQASAGMLAPHVEAHGGGPLLDLGLRSLALYPDWISAVRRESGDAIEFGIIGTLEVARSGERADELRRAAGADAGWLDPPDVARTYPHLSTTMGALATRRHGYVAAAQLAGSLARAAERAGARFQAARALRVSADPAGLRVTTTSGIFAAPHLVLAAGAWTNALDGIRTPPVRPVRGQLIRLEWPALPLPTIIWGPACYVVPRTDGSVLVGATVEDVGFDERTTDEGIQGLLEAAADLLPILKGARLIEARAGLRPATPDDLPVIGPDPAVPGLVHATGHYRNGVLLAPITAALIGDMIVEHKVAPLLASFRPDRF